MTNNKHCLVYETLGKVSDLTIKEGAGDGLMRLEGIFGVCGIKNQNNRVYDRENYRQMVESLQQVIKESGCPGELEHPNSMNINLENVSHKIESIQMNEDGTITGTIVLLNTPKGQIAQAIVEGGLPLYISSRGAGTITNEGRVTLSTIKTYDLVGTPGFSQAKLSLKSNQTLECLNESLEDGNVMYAIIDEGDDDLLDLDDDKKDDKKEDDKKDSDEKKDDEKKDDEKEEKSDDKKDDEKSEDKKENKDNKNNTEKIDMKDLKEAIDKLSDKVTSLEAQLHIAQESLDSVPQVNYDAIQEWITNEFAESFNSQIMDNVNNIVVERLNNSDINSTIKDNINEAVELISNGVQQWIVEEFAPEVQNWVCEEFAPEVQNWVCEEFAPEVQNWITEEYSPEVQNWITEEYSPEVQNWITEEFAPVVDSWINEEFAPEHANQIIESQNAGRLEEIDSVLESLSNNGNKDLDNIVKENSENDKYKNVFVVENMPSEFKPSWETLTEERKDEIVRSSRMYDFTKEGVLESFWNNVDFTKKDNITLVKESQTNSPVNDYHQSIISRMMYLRKQK